jgi:hypothetical protein
VVLWGEPGGSLKELKERFATRTWSWPARPRDSSGKRRDDTVVSPDKAQAVLTTQRHEPREHPGDDALRKEVGRDRVRFHGRTSRSRTIDLPGWLRSQSHATRPCHDERGVKATRCETDLRIGAAAGGGGKGKPIERPTTRRARGA